MAQEHRRRRPQCLLTERQRIARWHREMHACGNDAVHRSERALELAARSGHELRLLREATRHHRTATEGIENARCVARRKTLLGKHGKERSPRRHERRAHGRHFRGRGPCPFRPGSRSFRARRPPDSRRPRRARPKSARCMRQERARERATSPSPQGHALLKGGSSHVELRMAREATGRERPQRRSVRCRGFGALPGSTRRRRGRSERRRRC